VTQTRRNEFTSEEESERADGTKDKFERTGIETLSITIINGTRRIVTWSKSDTFGFGAQEGQDPAQYQTSAVSGATPNSNNGDGTTNGASGNTDPGDDSGFESGIKTHAEVSISFEDQIITLPDGRQAHVYSLSFGTGRSFRSKVEGGYGIKQREGVLKSFGAESEGGAPSQGSQGGTTGTSGSGGSGSSTAPNLTNFSPGLIANRQVEPGGNGSSVDASGGFSFGAGASVGSSIIVSAVVPFGESIDDVSVSGGTGFFAAADTSADVNESIGLASQESSGADGTGSAGHEYLSFSASSGGGGSKDFHFCWVGWAPMQWGSFTNRRRRTARAQQCPPTVTSQSRSG